MTQSILLTNKAFPLVLAGSTFTALIGTPAMASTFSTEPIYQTILNYETRLPLNSSFQDQDTLKNFDFTDIYYPESSDPSVTFPIALMFQGGNVDKENYSSFASQVASYGFLVAVPNHPRKSLEGLFPVQELVHDTLDFMKDENINSGSPIEGKVDVDNLGLLGHSFGGVAGLGAIQETCLFPFCITGEFTRPEALKAGIFYGTNLVNPVTGNVPRIDNEGIPTGLIGGKLDGRSEFKEVRQTYQQIQDPPKVLVKVMGANHYGITNNNNPINNNPIYEDPVPDNNPPTLDQETATETIARWSGLFLRAHVLEDTEAFNYVYNIGDAQDENVTVISAKVPESSDTWGIFLLGMGITIGSVVKGNTKSR